MQEINERTGYHDGIRSERPATGGARITIAQLHRASRAAREAYLRGFVRGRDLERAQRRG